VKAQGRLGEVAADLYTDFPERFEQRTRVYLLDAAGSRRELKIEQHWFHKGRVVLKFAGVDSISQAEQLAGCEVQLPAKERTPLGSEEVYVSDLVGCRVVDGEREIGEVADVMFGAGEAPLLIVRGDKAEHMIPFAQDYLKRVDTAGKRLEMQLPEGMLELDAPLSEEEKKLQQGDL
jgi:16S rRNA processing protein RimM